MKINQRLIILLVGVFAFSACSDDDEPTLPISVNFSNTELGLSDEVEVTVSFSRPVTTSGSINISVDASNLNYGADLDYYTEPAAEEGIITIPYESGDESLTLTIKAGNTLNIQEDQTISLSLVEVEGLELGNDFAATVTVSENFVAANGQLIMDAGGPDFTHQVFVDLSKQNQTRVEKDSWDLGFYSGDGFYVVLNSAAGVMARPLENTDILEVTSSDTVGFASEMITNGFGPEGSASWVDDPSGELNETVFGLISADVENVFIVKGSTGLWQKVVVVEIDGSYEVRYGDISATSVETVTISKSQTNNFTFFSFTDGLVSVEPEKDKWDITYSTNTIVLSTDFSGNPLPYPVPYLFNDIIFINRENVSVSMIMEDETTDYEGLDIGVAQGLTYSSDISTIGSSWRSVFADPPVFADRFYVLRDSNENYYKMKFLSLTNGESERGYVTFEYELL